MKFAAVSCGFYSFTGRRLVLKKFCNFSGAAWSLKSRSASNVSRAGFDSYEKERSTWNITIPEKFNFAQDVIDVWARKEKEGLRDLSIPAFWFVSEKGKELKWSFQDLERETKKVANMLQKKCGIQHGDNIIVMLPKVPEFWLVNVAAIRIGAVLCPAGMMLTAKDLAYRFTAFKPVSIIAHESVTERIDQVITSYSTLKTKICVSESETDNKEGWLNFHRLLDHVAEDHKCIETKSDESMMVFFTSGTTGQPKMVEHSHASYGLGHLTTGKHFQDLTSESIFWNLSDTGWAKTAYSGIFAPWLFGACVYVHGMSRFSASQTLQILAKYPIDTFCGPPMAFRAMVHEDLSNYKFSRLEHCLSGGEALNPEVLKKVARCYRAENIRMLWAN
ncbi:acyl-coenzyme A synthetase ACSM4, mitochondrial [Caerostris extrusa]|uniref:medium-chain acyl-CoA ligase n=1 Tax=Caerostris extrusa TaxID=172846 RepID=A0AAV4MJ28_CAEEX|nr:acyl-coenzyme A synthetase ACSM4, mitochondrial [Caerostris extrusa]